MWLTQGSASAPGALHLPQPCSPPAQHSTGCRSSPCSPSSPHEEPIWGICPPILPHEAKGRGHLGKVWRRDREEGASSSVSVTCMQIPVSQRRGLHPPRVQAEAGSSLSHAASRCPWGALLSSRTSKNYFKPNPCKAAICSCVSVAARPPGSSFSPLWGGGGRNIYINLYVGVPAAIALHRSLISLPPWSRWPSVLPWPAGRRWQASPRAALGGLESTWSAAGRGVRPWARQG